MAQDLNPAASLFTTDDNMPDPGDAVSAEQIQRLADNTGFNWLGVSNRTRISYGTVNLDLTTESATQVNFSTAVDGVSSFVTTTYRVFLQLATDPVTTAVWNASLNIENRQTTSFDVQNRNVVSGATSMDFFWVAIGE